MQSARTEVKAQPHYQLHRAAIQPAEDAQEDAREDDPELLQVGVAVDGPGWHLFGESDKHASMVSGRQGDGRANGIHFPKYNFHYSSLKLILSSLDRFSRSCTT